MFMSEQESLMVVDSLERVKTGLASYQDYVKIKKALYLQAVQINSLIDQIDELESVAGVDHG